MKLREIFLYEVGYRLRSASTWFYGAFLLLVTFWIFLATSSGGGAADGNAPVRLAAVFMVVGMVGMLVTAALFGDAAVRDAQAEMDPLVFTSPVAKAEYLGGRFLGALAVNAVLLLAVPIGILIATQVRLPDATYGPFRVLAYAQAFLLFTLPNLVLIGAVLFTVAVLARHVVPVYLAAIGFFIAYVSALNYTSQLGSPTLTMLADPVGIAAVQELSRYWTPAEQNARLIGLPGVLAWNRAIWLTVAVGVLALLHRRFRFAHVEGGGRRRRGKRVVADPASERPGPVSVPRATGSFGWRTTARQTFAVARRSLRDAAASRWFAVVLVACVGLTMLWGWNVGDTVFDTSTWPVTLLVVETVLSQRIVALPYVLIALYAGELVWREREAGEAEIADAAPVPGHAALLGRFLALIAMLAMFQAGSVVGGILIQALQGYYHFEPGLYLTVAFGLDLADYVLMAALAMTIHVLVDHKYVGHMVVVMAYILIVGAGPLLGLRHHLLVYGTDPGWTYSDMNGFGPFLAPFFWFKAYWAAWALLLGVVAALSWVRGPETGLRRRLRQARERFAGPVARAAGVAVVLILGLGGFIYYNTNILNEYRPPDRAGAERAAYEKRYGRYEDVPQPTVVAADVRAEIHPDDPAVELRGTYVLVNETDVPIGSVHLVLDRAVEARSLSIGRAAVPVVVDDEVGYRIYALARALEPGDSVELAFDVAFRPRGFRNGGIPTEVVGNGAYFDRRWMPIIGYQPILELSEESERRRFGLEPRPSAPSPHEGIEPAVRHSIRDADRVQVRMVIGTAADQIAVTPGVLRRSWEEDGRRYFEYETARPTSFGAAVFSAEYAVLEDRWNDVDLRIFHHPAHTYDLDRMVRGMKASLAYYTERFGPYPDDQLRIVEVPRYGGFGRAHPHTISFTEDHFLSRVRDGEVDQPFFGTAHEVAHQWWGGQARGASGVRGAGFLSESLANYSAMMVTEKVYGAEAARRVYDFQMERYLRGRARAGGEVPLLEVEDQPYIAYRKGAVAMYALREHIGADRVDAALRRYLEKYRHAGPPYPTSLDLYAELRAVTPDSLHPLLEDLFETITLWEVRADRAVVEPTGTGEYTVTLDVAARKLRVDGGGEETEVPMDDVVEIGVFAPAEGDGPGEPLYLERRRIRSGEQTIRVTVPGRPGRAGIDPYGWLIDRQRDDNVVRVEASGGEVVDPGG